MFLVFSCIFPFALKNQHGISPFRRGLSVYLRLRATPRCKAWRTNISRAWPSLGVLSI
jgi:hypothetical protein